MVYQTGAPDRGEADLDAIFAALSHPSRRALMRHLLADGSPSGVTDLAGAAGMSPQLLNKHATALERAGLVTRERAGREKLVRAHPEALGPALQWIEETSAFWGAQLDSLEAYVATMRGRGGPPGEED